MSVKYRHSRSGITATLPDVLKSAIQNYAQANRLSFSSAITELCARSLDLDPEEFKRVTTKLKPLTGEDLGYGVTPLVSYPVNLDDLYYNRRRPYSVYDTILAPGSRWGNGELVEEDLKVGIRKLRESDGY